MFHQIFHCLLEIKNLWIFFENLKISENNIISVELTKVVMHMLFAFDYKTQNLFFFLCIFFLMKKIQTFVICNDFMNVKHGLHHLKYDSVLKCLWICFKNKFKYFMHDVFLVTHM